MCSACSGRDANALTTARVTESARHAKIASHTSACVGQGYRRRVSARRVHLAVACSAPSRDLTSANIEHSESCIVCSSLACARSPGLQHTQVRCAQRTTGSRGRPDGQRRAICPDPHRRCVLKHRIARSGRHVRPFLSSKPPSIQISQLRCGRCAFADCSVAPCGQHDSV